MSWLADPARHPKPATPAYQDQAHFSFSLALLIIGLPFPTLLKTIHQTFCIPPNANRRSRGQSSTGIGSDRRIDRVQTISSEERLTTTVTKITSFTAQLLIRNDLLIALHLAQDLIRDCSVLGMMLRDSTTCTNIPKDVTLEIN
jgi:hypothetical protein